MRTVRNTRWDRALLPSGRCLRQAAWALVHLRGALPSEQAPQNLRADFRAPIIDPLRVEPPRGVGGRGMEVAAAARTVPTRPCNPRAS